MKFNETLSTKILRESTDEAQRTVVAGVLEGDFLSANKRFYPEAIVRGVSESLVGKSSMIGHDTNSPRDVVAKITSSAMSGKKLIASFKFGSDPSSSEMFTKVREGLVDSYSIRAWGESKPGKINGEDVSIVTELNIETVDLVVTPGVSSSKVLKVFESAPTVDFTQENEMELKELQEKLDVAEKALKVSEASEATLKESNQKSEEARIKAELSAHMEKALTSVKEEYRQAIKDACSDARDIAEFDKRFEAQKKLVESIAKIAKVDVIISPTDKKRDETKHYKNVNEALDSSDLDSGEKKNILVSMLGGTVKK